VLDGRRGKRDYTANVVENECGVDVYFTRTVVLHRRTDYFGGETVGDAVAERARGEITGEDGENGGGGEAAADDK
jgi:hypothetical protein